MISVASNVLEDIGRRAETLADTLLTAGTRKLPGYAAYAKALQERVSSGRADGSDAEAAVAEVPRDAAAREPD